MDVYQAWSKKLWDEWNLRTLVLLSLILQVLLTSLGSRRKYYRSISIRIVVWSACLLAETVATLALGAISSGLGDIYDNSGKVNPNVELNAFWAPFMLLHLGGPDTITTYALEDNESWLRHLIGLVGETSIALYVFLLAWTGSRLSILAVLMILVGLFKYGERARVLWLVSSEGAEKFFPDENAFFEDGVFEPANAHVFEVDGSQEGIIYMAYRLTGFYLPRMGKIDRPEFFYSMRYIKNGPANYIRTLIEVQLGFMYDLLYTKAKVVYSTCSLVLRLIGFSITCMVFMLFSIGVIRTNNYSKVDLTITYVLLASAISLDLYSAFALFFSNWSTALLYQHTRKHPLCKPIADFQKSFNGSPLWSNSVGQFSLLRFSFGEKHVRFGSVLKRFPIVHKKLELEESITYATGKDIWNDRFIDKVSSNKFRSVVGRRPLNIDVAVVEKGLIENLFRCMPRFKKENFIIVWHIATELCYHFDADAEEMANYGWELEISIHISQYMMYLFVTYPSMFSGGVAEKMFEETCDKARNAYKEGSGSTSPPIRDSSDYIQLYNQLRSGHTPTEEVALYLKKEELSPISADLRSCFQLTDLIPPAVWVSSILDEISNMKVKWEMICDVWVKLLLCVASQWPGKEHVQQLRRGGELITHVSLFKLHMATNY